MCRSVQNMKILIFHIYFLNMDISLTIYSTYLLENVYVYFLDVSGGKHVSNF